MTVTSSSPPAPGASRLACIGVGCLALWACDIEPIPARDASGRPDASTPDGGPLQDGDVPGSPVTLRGAAEKGPFVLGSSVSVIAAGATGAPTGLVFHGETTDDLGHFEVSVDYAGPVALEATGFFYNEVTAALSSAPLTLRGWFDVSDHGEQTANLNVITHLANRRTRALMESGMALSEAVQQAEAELVQVLGIAPPMTAVVGSSQTISDSVYLFAASAVLAEAGRLRAGGAGALQELLNQIAVDLEDDGALSAVLYEELRSAQDSLDPHLAMDHLAARMMELGQAGSPPDLDLVLDSDLDGLLNEGDNCPNVANADQRDGNGDGVGDVCCDNPSICWNGGTCATEPNGTGYSCSCVLPEPLTIDGADKVATVAPCTEIRGGLNVTAAIGVHLPLLTSMTGDLTVTAAAELNLPRLGSAGGLAVAGDQPMSLSLPALTTLGALRLTTSAVTQLDLPELASALEIHIYNWALASIDLPKLSSDVRTVVVKNTQLTSLNFPKLTKIHWQFVLENNPLLTTLSFPELTSLTSVTLGEAVVSVNMPKLATVEGNLSLEGSALTQLNMPSVASIGWRLTVSENTLLTSVSFPVLTIIQEGLWVEANAELTSLSFPLLATVGSVNTTYAFYIVGNPKLSTAHARALADQVTHVMGATYIDMNAP